MNTHTDRCTRAQHRRGTASTHAWRDAPREIPPLMHLALESDGQAPCEVRFQPTHPNPTLNMRTTCTIECTCPNFFLFRVSLARTRLFVFFFLFKSLHFLQKALGMGDDDSSPKCTWQLCTHPTAAVPQPSRTERDNS